MIMIRIALSRKESLNISNELSNIDFKYIPNVISKDISLISWHSLVLYLIMCVWLFESLLDLERQFGFATPVCFHYFPNCRNSIFPPEPIGGKISV